MRRIMDDFFELPAPDPDDDRMQELRHKQPDWLGPPDNYLPALVPKEWTIGRSPQAIVHMSGIRAYPAGWAFSLITMTDPDQRQDPWDDPQEIMVRRGMRPLRTGDAIPDSLMRFGFQFPDGSKVTSLKAGWGNDYSEHGQPLTPCLSQGGGSGGGSQWEWEYWCWPIPDDGVLKIVCEWPSVGIARTETTVDTALIRNAADRAMQLWPDPPSPSSSAGGVGVWVN